PSTVVPLTPTYTNNTNVGTAGASASYAGDANHTGSGNSGSFAISKATSSVTVICPTTALTYTGAAQTPCTATYTTSEAPSTVVPLTPTYTNNTNVGTAGASASYAGDANHTGSGNSGSFAISKATSSVTVICPTTALTYTGAAQTPCTATYTTSEAPSTVVPLTPTYTNNTNVGTAGASASYAGDANHTGSGNSGSFAISKATSSVTVICPTTALTYTGAAQTPCTATYTTSEAPSTVVPLTPTYTNNTNVGTAGASGSYAGDANHTGSSNSGSFAIAKVNPNVTVTPYSVAFDGKAHTATGTATGAGGVSLTGLTLSGTTHTNAATYGTDSWTFTDSAGNYNNASGTVQDIIAKANTTTTLTASPNPSNFGQSVALTATVAPVAPGAGTATGTVTFKDGSATLGTATLNSADTATFT